jgi:hypothetical protein
MCIRMAVVADAVVGGGVCAQQSPLCVFKEPLAATVRGSPATPAAKLYTLVLSLPAAVLPNTVVSIALSGSDGVVTSSFPSTIVVPADESSIIVDFAIIPLSTARTVTVTVAVSSASTDLRYRRAIAAPVRLTVESEAITCPTRRVLAPGVGCNCVSGFVSDTAGNCVLGEVLAVSDLSVSLREGSNRTVTLSLLRCPEAGKQVVVAVGGALNVPYLPLTVVNGTGAAVAMPLVFTAADCAGATSAKRALTFVYGKDSNYTGNFATVIEFTIEDTTTDPAYTPVPVNIKWARTMPFQTIDADVQCTLLNREATACVCSSTMHVVPATPSSPPVCAFNVPATTTVTQLPSTPASLNTTFTVTITLASPVQTARSVLLSFSTTSSGLSALPAPVTLEAGASKFAFNVTAQAFATTRNVTIVTSFIPAGTSDSRFADAYTFVAQARATIPTLACPPRTAFATGVGCVCNAAAGFSPDTAGCVLGDMLRVNTTTLTLPEGNRRAIAVTLLRCPAAGTTVVVQPTVIAPRNVKLLLDGIVWNLVFTASSCGNAKEATQVVGVIYGMDGVYTGDSRASITFNVDASLTTDPAFAPQPVERSWARLVTLALIDNTTAIPDMGDSWSSSDDDGLTVCQLRNRDPLKECSCAEGTNTTAKSSTLDPVCAYLTPFVASSFVSFANATWTSITVVVKLPSPVEDSRTVALSVAVPTSATVFGLPSIVTFPSKAYTASFVVNVVPTAANRTLPLTLAVLPVTTDARYAQSDARPTTVTLEVPAVVCGPRRELVPGAGCLCV